MKLLNLISRIIVGSVFIFSGFVKAVDPMGLTYKFSDYFLAFGIQFLDPIALPLAILLSSAEFLIGISLFFGYQYKLASFILVIFMSFFTILTLIIALTNPVSDCGCFGDAIIMTNWQTFYKNIALLPFTFIIFRERKKILMLFTSAEQWIFLGVYTIIIIFLQVYSLNHLPPLDFRPYSIGTYIPEKMVFPEDAPVDEYKTYLYYEKEGKVEEFNEENYPWQDTTWKFVESKHLLVKKGYEPPIHDFTMSDRNGYDHTDAVLADTDYTLLLISGNLSKADENAMKYANVLSATALGNNWSFYCLTSSSDPEIEKISGSLDLDYGFLTADEITLKTIIRSNPGLLLIKEGIIIDKWHFRDFPDPGKLNNVSMAKSLTKIRRENERATVLFFVAFIFFIALSIRELFPARSLE